MKIRLLAISFLGCALCVRAEDTAAPPPESNKAAAVQETNGRIVVELEVDGKPEKRLLDLNDPATAAMLKGKVIITTEINGRKESRVVDFKDADKLLPPWMFNEKPPVRTGPVTYLGVATMEVPGEVSAQLPLLPDTGLLIGAVAPDSPAARAGLQDSDVLSKFDDQILITQRQLAVLIANHKEGDAIKLTYFRKGQQMETTASLGKHIAAATMEHADPLARVTRRILKIGDDGKPQMPEGGKATEGLIENLKFKDPWGGEYRVLPADHQAWLSEHRRRDLPAEQNVGRDIRRALEQLPAEIRPQVEKLLLESGVVPEGGIPPKGEPVPPAPPGESKNK